MVHKTNIPDVDMDQIVTILYFMFYELRFLTYLTHNFFFFTHTKKQKYIIEKKYTFMYNHVISLHEKKHSASHHRTNFERENNNKKTMEKISKQYGE